MKVEDILKDKGPRVVTLTTESTVAQAAKVMIQERIGGVVVCDAEGKLRGVLSERDIVQGLNDYGEKVLPMKIGDLLGKHTVTVGPGDSLLKVMALMTDRRVRHLPIVDEEGHLSGIVSIGDAVKSRIEEIEAEAKTLWEYITQPKRET
jgi:CBS domain-containing protein